MGNTDSDPDCINYRNQKYGHKVVEVINDNRPKKEWKTATIKSWSMSDAFVRILQNNLALLGYYYLFKSTLWYICKYFTAVSPTKDVFVHLKIIYIYDKWF